MPGTYILKAEGKVVTVKDFHGSDGEKMCAIECRAGDQKKYKVRVCEKTNAENRLMAFYFPKKKNCWIKVVDNKIMVEKTESETFPETPNYWFVKKNNGAGKEYSLIPLVAPSAWLALLQDRPYSFFLTEHAEESAQVSVESI